MDASGCKACDTPQLPTLQSSCSPDNSDATAELTRWQRLRGLAQTKSLLPPSAPSRAIAVGGSPHASHTASSRLDHFKIPAMAPQDLAVVLRQPGKFASARARSLLESQHVISISDSLDADLQVEAVLRKAAARAACLAGLPKEPASQCKVLATQPNSLHNDQQQVAANSTYDSAFHKVTCPCS